MSQTTSTTFEVEVDISGAYDRPDRSVGWSGGYVDTSVEGLYALRHERKDGRSAWHRVDLLVGLDAQAKRILLNNIADFLGDDAMAEALEEAA
ncbi:MAG: hypothetical protein ACM3W4_01620 [Ignavibacteriales bacterium]